MTPAEEHVLARQIAAILDEATVAWLRLTSPVAALVDADHQERAGVPAYDRAAPVAGRDELRTCPHCGRRFWSTCGQRTYCTEACRRRRKSMVRDRRRRDARRAVAA